MHSHPNARLTQRGRLRLVIQHLEHGRSLAELAAENGISLRCAYRWLARYRSGGAASLADRRSVRRTQRRTLDPQQLQQAVDLRHQRLYLRHIARLLRAPFSTVARALSRLGPVTFRKVVTLGLLFKQPEPMVSPVPTEALLVVC
jgi:transposase